MNGTWDSGRTYFASGLRERNDDPGARHTPSEHEPVLSLRSGASWGVFWHPETRPTGNAAAWGGCASRAELWGEGLTLTPSYAERTYDTDEAARDDAISWLQRMTMRGYFLPAPKENEP